MCVSNISLISLRTLSPVTLLSLHNVSVPIIPGVSITIPTVILGLFVLNNTVIGSAVNYYLSFISKDFSLIFSGNSSMDTFFVSFLNVILISYTHLLSLVCFNVGTYTIT